MAVEGRDVPAPVRADPDGVGVDEPVQLALRLGVLLPDGGLVLEPDRLELEAVADALGLLDVRGAADVERHHLLPVRLRRVLADSQELAEVGGGEVLVRPIVAARRDPLLDGAHGIDQDDELAGLHLTDRALVQASEELPECLRIIEPVLDDVGRQIRGHLVQHRSAEPEQLPFRSNLVFHGLLLG